MTDETIEDVRAERDRCKQALRELRHLLSPDLERLTPDTIEREANRIINNALGQ